jgi:hypothetical protein
MNLTKRQRMLSAMFLVGLVGLVADRTLLRPQGGPAAASAEVLPASPNAAASSAGAPSVEGTPAPTPVPERLNKLLSGQEIQVDELRDPFALPPSWSGTTAGAGKKAPDAITTFVRKHQLKAVFMQGQETCVQVDDNFLVPGQSVDGFKLVSVNQRIAVFEHEGKEVTLELVSK